MAMMCPSCGETLLADHPTVLGGVAFACGYCRGDAVGVGYLFTAINGSTVRVTSSNPISGMFRGEVKNLIGGTQNLWYERNGDCMGPNGRTRWDGDDIPHMTGVVKEHFLDSDCKMGNVVPEEVEEITYNDLKESSRWDEI